MASKYQLSEIQDGGNSILFVPKTGSIKYCSTSKKHQTPGRDSLPTRAEVRFL